MKKDLKVQPALFPMPVLLIATYDEEGNIDVMNMAWGGICASDAVALNLSEGHRTTKNIKERNAFTIAFATEPYLKEADYFGMVSGNTVPDKFARSGLHAEKSVHVDAPIVAEFPVTLECEVQDIMEQNGEAHIVGRIVNVLADEDVLDAQGKIDSDKFQGVVFDGLKGRYLSLGKEVGKAWQMGKELIE